METGEVIGPARVLPFAPFPEGAAPLRLRTFFSVEEEYTDNADETKNNRKSEFRTTIAPGIAAHAEGARTSLDLAYALRAFIPHNRTSDATLDHELTFRGWHDLTPRLRFSAGEDFTRSPDFPQFGNLGGRPTAGQAVNSNTVTGELAYTYGATRTGLSYSNLLILSESSTTEDSITHVARGTIDFTDARYGLGGSYALTRGDFTISSPYWEHTVDGRAYRVFTPKVRGILSGSFTDHNVDQPQAQDFRIGRGRLGGVLSLGPNGSLSAEAGADVFMPQGAGSRVFPSGAATLTHRFPILALALSYQETLIEQFQTIGNPGLTHTRSASLLLSSLAFRDLTPSLAVRWNWRRIEQATPTGAPAGTVDRTMDVETRLQYFILRPLTVTLSYILTLRTSNDPTAGFVENRVRLGLTLVYDLF